MIKELNSKLLITLVMLISIVCVGISATVGSAEENEPEAAEQIIQFTVKHNIRDIDADSYTAISSDEKEARAEDADSIKISDIVSDRWISEGFVFEENRSIIIFGEEAIAINSDSVNVTPHGDDHAVIELYYDRPEYPYVISYVLDNGGGNSTEIKRSLPDDPCQPLGKTVSAEAPDVFSEDTDDEMKIIYERTDSASKTLNIVPESDYIGDNGAIDPYKVKNNVITFFYAIKDTADPEDGTIKDTTGSEDDVIKDSAASKDDAVKDTAASKDDAIKDTAASKGDVIKDTAASKDDAVKDTAASEDDVIEDTADPEDDAIEDTADPEDESEAEDLKTATGKLIIVQSGGRNNESFLYRITSGDGTSLTVSVKGGSSATIVVPLGKFKIEELSDWSWRYDAISASQEITIDDPNNNKTVTFSDRPNDKSWQGGESSNRGHF